MADSNDDRSGSRWEPGPDEQRTEQLGQPTDVIPGLQAQEQLPVGPKRRVPRAAAAVAIVAAATLGGGIAGMALAGNQTQDVNDTTIADTGGTTTEQQPFGPGDGTTSEQQPFEVPGDDGTSTEQQPFGPGDGKGWGRDGGRFGHGHGGH